VSGALDGEALEGGALDGGALDGGAMDGGAVDGRAMDATGPGGSALGGEVVDEAAISEPARRPPAEVMIEGEGLGIKFLKSRRRNLKLRDLFVQGGKRRLRVDEFWALKDISFQIHDGDAVGIIGRNGTGKSTLLKLIAGVLIPDEGTIRTYGKVAPLLELSAGFTNELTGRENVQVVGALHGISRSDMRDVLPKIFEFAGDKVSENIDLPIRHYSTGMKVRLGFAVIAHLAHPILLVDEVLAVGDRDFREKCYTTIESMLAEGRTLVLVSHNEADLTRFCNRGIFIDAGSMEVDGPVADALAAYNGHASKE
jgi:ABC-2 type transport system ATP-binding protein